MKRKLVMLLTIVAVLAVGIGIWYNVPINLMDLEHDEVIEIVVFNGNTGNATHITDETQIEHIIENLNEIKLKRSKPSVGYSGYSFKMTIYLSDGNEADDWNNFIINSDDTIRKDPFFYKVVSEKIDYNLHFVHSHRSFYLVNVVHIVFVTAFLKKNRNFISFVYLHKKCRHTCK